MPRRNGCKGKVKHADKRSAVLALKRIGNAALNAYPCRVCGGWHLGTGHQPWKVQARLDQLLGGAK